MASAAAAKYRIAVSHRSFPFFTGGDLHYRTVQATGINIFRKPFYF